MSLYVFNPFRVSEELLPPQIRKPKMIAWLRVLLRPIKHITDLFNNEFINGATCAKYNNATTYYLYDKVIWKDFGVYELRVDSSVGVHPTGDTDSATTWYLVQKNFIGIDEQAAFNGQNIVMAYAINKQFGVTTNPYIYFGTVATGAANASVDVYFPIAVYTALASTNAQRDAIIKTWIGQYKIAGFDVVIHTY